MSTERTQGKVVRVQNLIAVSKIKTPQVGRLRLRLRIQAHKFRNSSTVRFVSHHGSRPTI